MRYQIKSAVNKLILLSGISGISFYVGRKSVQSSLDNNVRSRNIIFM